MIDERKMELLNQLSALGALLSDYTDWIKYYSSIGGYYSSGKRQSYERMVDQTLNKIRNIVEQLSLYSIE